MIVAGAFLSRAVSVLVQQKWAVAAVARNPWTAGGTIAQAWSSSAQRRTGCSLSPQPMDLGQLISAEATVGPAVVGLPAEGGLPPIRSGPG